MDESEGLWVDGSKAGQKACQKLSDACFDETATGSHKESIVTTAARHALHCYLFDCANKA